MPAVETLLSGRRTRLAVLGGAFAGGMQHSLQRQEVRLGRCRVSPAPLMALLRERRIALGGAAGQLEAVSPLAVLARGYALVTADGHPVTKAADLKSGQQVDLTFGDGACHAVIGGRPVQGLLDL